MLESLGATIDEVSTVWINHTRLLTMTIFFAESTSSLWNTVKKHRNELGDDVRVLLETGNLIFAVDYLGAQRLRTKVMEEANKLLRRYDLLVTPTTPTTATKIGQTEAVLKGRKSISVLEMIARFTAVFNFTGHPAITVPCGFSSSSLPVGLQIAGKHFSEAKVLTAAHAYETRTSWHKLQPSL